MSKLLAYLQSQTRQTYCAGQNGVREEPQDQQYAALDTDSDSSEDAEDVRADYAQLNQNVTSTDGENRQPDETAAQNQLQSERVNNARNADTDEVRQRAWWTATQLTRDGEFPPKNSARTAKDQV